MKNLAFRLALGASAGVITFALWRFGMWAGSLMTQRTPLYFAVHGWASAIICPLIGLWFLIFSGQEDPL